MKHTFGPAVKDAAQIVAEPTQGFLEDSARVADIAAAFEAVSREEQADSPKRSKLLKRAKSLLLRYKVDRNKSLQTLAKAEMDRALERIPAAPPGSEAALKEQAVMWENLLVDATKSLVGAQVELEKALGEAGPKTGLKDGKNHRAA